MLKKIFIKSDSLSDLARLTKGELLVLSELLKRVSLEGDYAGYLILNSSIRKEITKELNISSATLNNALNAISKKNIAVRKDTNMYIPNKNVFDIH